MQKCFSVCFRLFITSEMSRVAYILNVCLFSVILLLLLLLHTIVRPISLFTNDVLNFVIYH